MRDVTKMTRSELVQAMNAELGIHVLLKKQAYKINRKKEREEILEKAMSHFWTATKYWDAAKVLPE